MVIHIAPIGLEIEHVYEGIKDKHFGTPEKLYLLHSPNQFKKIAQKLKQKVKGYCDTYLMASNYSPYCSKQIRHL